MILEHLNLKPRNPYFSLALEEAFSIYLANNHSGFSSGVRLWVCSPSIILGRTCKLQENIKNTKLIQEYSQNNYFQKDSVQLCRRLSGGGTVVHGSGSINYSIYLCLARYARFYNVTKSYEILLSTIRKALSAQGIETHQRGLSDLVIQKDGVEYKISGNSQFRKYGILVFHGTLITNTGLFKMIEDHLLHPPREPEYRNNRDHADFLGSLPESFEIASFYQCFRNGVSELCHDPSLGPIPAADIRKIYSNAKELCKKIYIKSDWVFDADGKCGRDTAHSRSAKAMHTV